MRVPVYEHPIWENLPDQAMRPGGLTLTEKAFSFAELSPGSKVLDLGCGLGATLRHLSVDYGLATFGIDLSASLLRRATGAAFTQARGEYVPLADDCMDVVISECTLSLFETDLALSEVVRVLRSGGWFILSDIYARNSDGISALQSLPAGTSISKAMAQPAIEAKIEGCGLKISNWQDLSAHLKGFSLCTLFTAAEVDPLDLIIASGKAKLGYYTLSARKS